MNSAKYVRNGRTRPEMQTGRMARVAVLLFDGCLGSSLGVLEDSLTLVNNLVAERLKRYSEPIEGVDQLRDPFVKYRLSPDGKSVRAFGGMSLDVDLSISETSEIFNIIYVPAVLFERVCGISSETMEMIALWLRRQHEGGAVLAAQGDSVALLARSGLLNQRPAAVAWSRIADYRRLFPAVRVEATDSVTVDENIYCAGTLAAGLHLCCYLTDRFTPAFIAISVRQFVLGAEHSLAGGEGPFGEPEDLIVARAKQWLARNYQAKLTLSELAQHLGVSERTLARRFMARLGMTPFHYVRQLRFDSAMRLLRSTTLRIDQIAVRVGYHNVRFFIRAFRRESGVTPAEYRRTCTTKRTGADELS